MTTKNFKLKKKIFPYNSLDLLYFSSVQFSRSVVSSSLQPHEPQHARPPCPSPTPGVHPNPCPLCRWCHPTISASVIPFSSGPQSFPASGYFQMNQLSASVYFKNCHTHFCYLHSIFKKRAASPHWRGDILLEVTNIEAYVLLACACTLTHFSCVWLCVTLLTLAHQAPLSMEFSQQEYWSGLSCPPLGDLLEPGTKPTSLTSPVLTGGFFITNAT